MQPWENGSCCTSAVPWASEPCYAVLRHTYRAQTKMCTFMHCNSTWHFKLLCRKMGKANKPESCGHPAPPRHSHCKYSFIYSHSVLPRALYSQYTTFPAWSIVIYLFYYRLYSWFISQILFLSWYSLWLMVTFGSCVISSPSPAQHVHRPQALASCRYFGKLHTLFAIPHRLGVAKPGRFSHCCPFTFCSVIVSFSRRLFYFRPITVSKTGFNRNWNRSKFTLTCFKKWLDLHCQQLSGYRIDLVQVLFLNLLGIADAQSGR